MQTNSLERMELMLESLVEEERAILGAGLSMPIAVCDFEEVEAIEVMEAVMEAEMDAADADEMEIDLKIDLKQIASPRPADDPPASFLEQTLQPPAPQAPADARIDEIPGSMTVAVDTAAVLAMLAELRGEIDRLRADAKPAVTPTVEPEIPAGVSDAILDAEADATAPAHPKAGRPPADEWGMYDPEQCGISALLNKLGTDAMDRPAESGKKRRAQARSRA